MLPNRPRPYPRRGRKKTSAAASISSNAHASAARSAKTEPLVFDASSSLNSWESLGSTALATTIDVHSSSTTQVVFPWMLGRRLSSELPMTKLDTGTQAYGTVFRYCSRGEITLRDGSPGPKAYRKVEFSSGQ